MRIRYSATKSASFNVQGLARASRAADALMRSLPEVDWATLVRAENRQIAAAGSMRKGRWRAIAKVITALVVVLVITIVVREVAMSTAPAEPERPPPRPADIAAATERTAARTRVARLEDVTHRYNLTCDPVLKPELVRLLGEAGRPEAAAKVESKPCVRELPSCAAINTTINRTLRQRYSFENDRVLDFSCRGITITNAAGELDSAFAVSISGRVRGSAATFRGVTSTEGADIIAFEIAPVAYSVGVGDLDGDHRDELVGVGGSRLVVTRIAGDRFVDIDGPALPEGCQADVTVESPPGRDTVLVVTTESPRSRGCPAAGRQVYRLAGNALQLAGSRSP